VGLEYLWTELALMLAYVLAVFTLASLLFKKKVG
jgi:hypothetical protein